MNARKVFLETFHNFDDASDWMEKHLDEHKDWHVVQADLRHINGSWRAGLIIEQGQLAFLFDHSDHLNLTSKDLDV